MAWSDEFREMLQTGGPSPMFALDFRSWPVPVTWSRGGVILYSHGVMGASTLPTWSDPLELGHAIGEQISVGAQSVNLRSWDVQSGSMSVKVASMDAARWIANNLPRGSVGELKVGFPGWEWARWQTVHIAQYRNMVGSGQDWSMSFVGVLDSLQSRKVTSGTLGDYSATFGDAGQYSTTVSSGGWSTGSATLNVASTANFVKDGATGIVPPSAPGLLYCEPSSGDAFYLKWTTSTAKQTPDSATSFTVQTDDVIGTTRTALSSGDAITHIDYVFDKPRHAVRKLLTSGGGVGLPGYNKLPAKWAYDLSRARFNESDLAKWALSPAHGSRVYYGDLVISTPPTDPWSTIQGWLKKFGYWIVLKEGGIGFRFAFDPTAPSTDLGYHVVDTIRDTDVVSVDSIEMYATDMPVEYVYFFGLAGVASGTNEGVPSTSPSVKNYLNDAVVHNDPTAASGNIANAAISLEERLAVWYLRVPCSIQLTLRGWRFASLAPGDYVRIKSSMIPDIYLESGTIDSRAYMVTSSAINWSGMSTRVTLATIPDKAIPTS